MIKKLSNKDKKDWKEFTNSDEKLEIKVKENPIIQTILIKGIKNKNIVRQLEEVTKKSEKYPFLINGFLLKCLFKDDIYY